LQLAVVDTAEVAGPPSRRSTVGAQTIASRSTSRSHRVAVIGLLREHGEITPETEAPIRLIASSPLNAVDIACVSLSLGSPCSADLDGGLQRRRDAVAAAPLPSVMASWSRA
jgi:hypothetical protein